MQSVRNRAQRDAFALPMFRQLWGPSMISCLGWALSDMADAIVVGQRMGTVGLAAIGLILPVYMINCTLAHGFGLGGSVTYSTLMGEGEKQSAVDSFSGVFWLSLIFSGVTAILGLFFMQPLLAFLGTRPADGALYHATRDYLQVLVASTPLFYMTNILNYYLRNDGSQKQAAMGSVAGNISDICFNLILVIGLDMGTRGAALATSLGQIVVLAIYLPVLARKDRFLHVLRPIKGWVKQALTRLKEGFTVSVSYLFQMVFFLVSNNVLMAAGGEAAVAVFDVLQNASYLIVYLYEGSARAMQPLLSTYHGEHNRSGCRTVRRVGYTLGMAVGLILIAFIQVWPDGLCRLFGVTGQQAWQLTQRALRIYGLGAIFIGLNILVSNDYNARGQEKVSLIIAILRGAVILLPATLIFSRAGVENFWWLFPVTEALTFLIFLILRAMNKFPAQELSEDRLYYKMVRGTPSNIVQVSREIRSFCQKWNASPHQIYMIAMTVEELGMTILKRAMKERPDGYIQFDVAALEDGEFEVRLRDNAISFDPFKVKAEKLDAGAEDDFDVDTVGLLVIRKTAKSFFYRRYQGFNTMVLRF